MTKRSLIDRWRRARRLKAAITERDRRRLARMSRIAWDGYIYAPTYREALFWLGEIRKCGL